MMNEHQFNKINGIVWITGLSGSGKTHVSNSLTDKLKSAGYDPIKIDGDTMRNSLFDARIIKNSYTRRERAALARYYVNLANELSVQGNIVIVSTISMFKEVYKYNREKATNYIEIYLNKPNELVQGRSTQNVYAKPKNVVGVDIFYDVPKHPDFEICDDVQTETCCEDIITKIMKDWK